MPCASRCAQPVGIEQLEDAALSGVVAHLRDALDLRGALERLRPVAGGRFAPFDDGRAERSDFAVQDGHKRRRPRLGLSGARFGERAFRSRAIEEWNRGVDCEHAADIAAQGRRGLRAGDDLRLGDPAALRGAQGKPCGLDVLPVSAQLAASGFGLRQQRVERRHRRH